MFIVYFTLRVFTIHDQCFKYLNHVILRYYLPLVLSVRTMCVALVKRVLRLTLKALCAVYAVLSHSTKTTFLLGAWGFPGRTYFASGFQLVKSLILYFFWKLTIFNFVISPNLGYIKPCLIVFLRHSFFSDRLQSCYQI